MKNEKAKDKKAKNKKAKNDKQVVSIAIFY